MFWKQRRPQVVNFVGGRYKWFVLAGTLMISLSPAVREQPRDVERQFSEAYESAERYTALRDELTAIRQEVRNLSAKLKAPDVQPTKSSRSNDGFINAIVVLTKGAEETLRDNESFIALAGTKERTHLEERNDDLKRELDTISHDLENAISIAISDKSEMKLFQQMQSLSPIFDRAEDALDQSQKLRVQVLVPLIFYRGRLETRSLMLNLLSYFMLAIGVLTVVSAQWIARPGEAPDLKLG